LENFMAIARILATPAEELIPELDVKYVDVHGLRDSCLRQIRPHKDTPPTNLLFNSPHGRGKTLLAADLTLSLGQERPSPVPLIIYDCSEDTREYDLIGTPTPTEDGGFAFQLGPFPLAIKLANEEGSAVLLAEEISALSPGAQKAFNRMTDWRKGIYVPQIGRMYKLNPGANLIVMATMNPSAYGGVYMLNQDLRSRFAEIQVPAPTRAQMIKILKSVCPWSSKQSIDRAAQLADESRSDATEYSLSTRDMAYMLKIAHRDGDLAFALQATLNKFEGSEKAVMADRINGIFSTKLLAGGAASHV
jgi:hypothetical protein